MKIEYASIKLPPNTIAGATCTSLTAKNGVTLTRVIEDGRDDLVVTKAGNPRGCFEIPWVQTKGGRRSDVGPALVKKPVSEPLVVDDEEPVGEIKNDAVRVTRRRGKQ